MRSLVALGAALVAFIATSPASATPGWRPPATLSAAGAYNVRVGIDARGDALAVYWQRANDAEPSAYRLEAAWRMAGGAWSAPQQLTPPGLVGVAPAGVAVSALGQVTIGLLSADGAARVAEGRLGKPLAVREVAPAGSDAGRVSVAVDDAGEAVAAWTGTTGVVRAALRALDGRWSAPRTLGAHANGAPPVVTMNPAGAAAVAWAQSDGGAARLAYRPPAGQLGPAESAPVPAALLGTQVAIDVAGEAVVTGAPVGPAGSIGFAVRNALGGYGPGQSLGDGSVEQALAEPSGAVSLVAGSRTPDGQYAVRFATRRADGAVIGPVTLDAANAAAPRAALTYGGAVLATWTRAFDGQARGSQIAVARRSARGEWSAAQVISDPDSIGSDIAADDAGQAVVAWSHNTTPGDMRSAVVQAAVLEDPARPVAPAPPAVDVAVPAPQRLGPTPLRAVVTCAHRCAITAQGLVHVGSRAWPLSPASAVAARAPHAARVRLAVPPAARRAARARRGGARAWASVTATARGRSSRPISVSRRLPLTLGRRHRGR